MSDILNLQKRTSHESEKSWIERFYKITNIQEISESRNLRMVSRLTYVPSQRPEIITTLLFESDFLEVEVIRGATSSVGVNSEIMRDFILTSGGFKKIKNEKESFKKKLLLEFDRYLKNNVNKFYKKNSRLSYCEIPNAIKKPETFMSIAEKAKDCFYEQSGIALDGEVYHHEIIYNNRKLYSVWQNQQKPQREIITLYYTIEKKVCFSKDGWYK